MAAGIRVKVDDSDNHNPGFKFNSWEVKGTPIRLELGNKDFEKNEVRCAIRHSSEKFQLAQEGIVQSILDTLEKIHGEMFAKALTARNEKLKDVNDWAGFMDALN
jgi:prolyl-tRNA synthetase